MINKKMEKDKNGKVKLDKPKDKKATYTKQEWQALAIDERLEILARALELIK